MTTHRKSGHSTQPHPASPGRSRSKPARSKSASLLAALTRPQGARLSDLEKITGWQAHSIRAALTGFRHQGYAIVRDKNAHGVTRYRVKRDETP
jgi:hypothetical protein